MVHMHSNLLPAFKDLLNRGCSPIVPFFVPKFNKLHEYFYGCCIGSSCPPLAWHCNYYGLSFLGKSDLPEKEK